MKAVFLFLISSKKRARTFAIFWTVLIFIACLIPGRDVPSVGFPGIDKWVHFLIFGGFSFLWLTTLRQTNLGRRILIFLLALTVGYIVELLQGSGITSGRSYDLMDVLADGIGGALGVLVFYWVNRAFNNTKTT